MVEHVFKSRKKQLNLDNLRWRGATKVRMYIALCCSVIFVKETFYYTASQGVSLNSHTREAIERILDGRLMGEEIASRRDSGTRDEEDWASRSRGELEFEDKSWFSKTIYRNWKENREYISRRLVKTKIVSSKWRKNC